MKTKALITGLILVCLPLCASANRYDGYTTYKVTDISSDSLNATAFTLNVLLAAESYPMMNATEAETMPTYATICGTLDDAEKKGFALQLSSQGDLRFQFYSAYSNGYLFTISGNEKMACGKWNVVSVVLDKANNKGVLYLNGNAIGTGKMGRSDIQHSYTSLYIGKDSKDILYDGFLLNTFCGYIENISIRASASSEEEIAEYAKGTLAAVTVPDFNYPASRYAESLWRPAYHGMPSGAWTNECHGMIYSEGKYHLFFQKNANGPYMARLHWGHLSSENLYDWNEEPIALYPTESYDIKGCWSGCVFTDNDITGSQPNIIYTAVDNEKAVIAQAVPADDSLTGWMKKGVIINGKPSGLSDDFRDPYFFTANGEKYIIVGTSKDGVGACTLHKYQNGSWTNDGRIFFKGTSVTAHGSFWEMPNVMDMGEGKWLFTCTPLGTSYGVRTLCWVGTINSDGTFNPSTSEPQYLELNGIGKEGYGLLSPTIYNNGEKTLLLGIVPDKLPSSVNYEMGWAHNYSLPREISIDANGALIQKPYSGLSAMRTSASYQYKDELNGSVSLSPVEGRQIEVKGEFVINGGEVGFHFLKSGSKQAVLSYNTDTGLLSLDLTSLDREINDAGVYDGRYSSYLPEIPVKGETVILHAFIDNSIADIFVNDKWAFSVRLFPTNASQTSAEVFATSTTTADVNAWILNPSASDADGINAIFAGKVIKGKCYSIDGMELPAKPYNGLYISNGKKFCVK